MPRLVTARRMPLTVTLVTARVRLMIATAKKTAKPPPSRATAIAKAAGAAVKKPVISVTVPRTSETWLILTTKRGAGRGEPATTGSICVSVPSITMARKPSVSAWVRASVCGVQREASDFGAHAIRPAAASRNSGAVRKNRSGSENGGACSKERPACAFIRTVNPVSALRPQCRPGGSG